jgi:hypothetical protein
MVLKKRIFLAAILLLVIFATVMLVSITQKDTADEFQGTLVYANTQGKELI